MHLVVGSGSSRRVSSRCGGAGSGDGSGGSEIGESPIVDSNGRPRFVQIVDGRCVPRRTRRSRLLRVWSSQPIGGAPGQPGSCRAIGRSCGGVVRGLALCRPRRRRGPLPLRVPTRGDWRRGIRRRRMPGFADQGRQQGAHRRDHGDVLADRAGLRRTGTGGGGLTTCPVLERGTDREGRREAVRLLMGEGTRRRPRLCEAAVAVIGSWRTPIAIVLERHEWARRGAIVNLEPSVGHRRDDTRTSGAVPAHHSSRIVTPVRAPTAEPPRPAVPAPR